MKKTIIFLFIGSVLAGAGLLAGIAYGFGAIAEAGVRHVAAQESPEDAAVAWQFDVAEYRRGLFSSETDSKIEVDSIGDVEITDNDVLPFHHVVYHGPLAMTPEGPKFCSYHIVTTLRVDQMDETDRKRLTEGFKGREPVTIRTTTHFGGAQKTRITVSPFSIETGEDEGETGGEMKFTGATATLETGPDLAYARGEFSIGSLTGNVEGDSPTRMEITPGNGTLDFVKNQKLIVKIKSGEMSSRSDDFLFDMDPSELEIDWGKSDHLKAHLTIGAIEAGDRNGLGSMIAGPGTLSMDYKRVSDTIGLLLGETKLSLDRMEIDMAGQQVSMKDFVLRADSGEKAGKLYGLLNYEVGAIQAPEDPDSPVSLSRIAGKGAEFEIGVEGFDLAAIEGLVEKARDTPELAGLGMMNLPSDPEDPDTEKTQEILTDMSREMLGLFRPGLKIYYKTRFRGEEGLSLADVEIGMGGDKKLIEFGTPREMLSALEGKLDLKISKKQHPPEEVLAMFEGDGANYFVDRPDCLEMIGKLAGGTITVNGEPTPLLDDLGPMLDEPFDWDAIIEGFAAGLATPAMLPTDEELLMEEDFPMEEDPPAEE